MLSKLKVDLHAMVNLQPPPAYKSKADLAVDVVVNSFYDVSRVKENV